MRETYETTISIAITQKVHKSNYYYELLKNFARRKIMLWNTCNLSLAKTLKQDPSKYKVWNIDKLYKLRNMCIKREKKQHVWDKGETHTSSSYILKEVQCM